MIYEEALQLENLKKIILESKFVISEWEMFLEIQINSVGTNEPTMCPMIKLRFKEQKLLKIMKLSPYKIAQFAH